MLRLVMLCLTHKISDRLVRRARTSCQPHRGSHRHAGLAAAALEKLELLPDQSQRVLCECIGLPTFDVADMTPFRHSQQRDAGSDRHSVQIHRAGAAPADAAAYMVPVGQAQRRMTHNSGVWEVHSDGRGSKQQGAKRSLGKDLDKAARLSAMGRSSAVSHLCRGHSTVPASTPTDSAPVAVRSRRCPSQAIDGTLSNTLRRQQNRRSGHLTERSTPRSQAAANCVSRLATCSALGSSVVRKASRA